VMIDQWMDLGNMHTNPDSRRGANFFQTRIAGAKGLGGVMELNE
jgi:hypothetical protein